MSTISKWCGSAPNHDSHSFSPVFSPDTVFKCPGYDRDQANGGFVACCEACAETLRMTTEIHAAFKGLAGAMAGIAKNPMMAAMTRQFGIDPAMLSTLAKTGE